MVTKYSKDTEKANNSFFTSPLFIVSRSAICLALLVLAVPRVNSKTASQSPSLVVEAKESIEQPRVETERQRIDRLILESSQLYFSKENEKQAELTLHCLIDKESKYNTNKGHGDGGLAGGPMQFHEDTYQRMRKHMMKNGYVNWKGTRYNLQDSIMTTAYALSEGWGTEWGPILRGECKNVRGGAQ